MVRYKMFTNLCVFIRCLYRYSEYKEAFNIFDRDGSGAISVKELEIALRSLGQTPSAEELNRMVNEVDKDGRTCMA